ncbi:hypothetical protein GCM10010404_66830 [Nonomuraea africana]
MGVGEILVHARHDGRVRLPHLGDAFDLGADQVDPDLRSTGADGRRTVVAEKGDPAEDVPPGRRRFGGSD